MQVQGVRALPPEPYLQVLKQGLDSLVLASHGYLCRRAAFYIPLEGSLYSNRRCNMGRCSQFSLRVLGKVHAASGRLHYDDGGP